MLCWAAVDSRLWTRPERRLLTLMRHIANSLVRAGIVRRAEEY